MAKNKHKEFLTLAVVSVIIVVAIFVGNPTPTGRFSSYSSTGVTWTCEWNNAYEWVPDNGDPALGEYIAAGNADIGCDPATWYCSSDLEGRKGECFSLNEGETCSCGKEKPYTLQIAAGG